MKKYFKIIKWLYPGLKIKRWILLILGGVVMILVSAPGSTRETGFKRMIFMALSTIGFTFFIIGIINFIKSLFEVLYPHKEKDLIDIIYEKRLLAKGPRIVAIGGGTGLSRLVEGLKDHTSNITAIVTVADEGGSSGRLREEFGILPPGDIRNCLVSLAEAPQLMRDLFQYRFTEGDGIKGHSFGNLFITAMTQVTGSFRDAVIESSKVLAIRGRVIPSSLDNIRLKAEYTDGSMREGENKIPNVEKPIKKLYLMPQDPKPNPEALEVIRDAQAIIMGPGSLFTSVLPNLLIPQIAEEIANRNIVKLYICNVMTQHGETGGFTAADHVAALQSHARKNIVNCCLVNSGRLEQSLLFKYAQDKSFPVVFDRTRLKKMGVMVFESDVVSQDNYLQHDSKVTAKEIMNIYYYFKKRWKGSQK